MVVAALDRRVTNRIDAELPPRCFSAAEVDPCDRENFAPGRRILNSHRCGYEHFTNPTRAVFLDRCRCSAAPSMN